MKTRIVILALAWWLALTSFAHAEPITIAIFSAIGITLQAGSVAAAVLTFVLTTAASLAVGLLSQKLFGPDLQKPGVQLDVEIGDDNPIGVIIGRYATAGTRKFSNVYGEDGDDVPNKYLVDVLQIGDIPAPGLPVLYVDGKRVTVLWDEEEEDGQGHPVEEYRDGDDDHLWIRYYDGTQTTASSYLRDLFGGDDERPWKASMIGRGCPYVVMTAEFDLELFSGRLQWVFEPPSIPLYDLRKDSSVGGSGSHRWNDKSTWEPSLNLAVQAYNIIRGVYYGSEWLFGGQNLSAFRLPAANWMAAMNECDALVDLKGGGTEPQFRGGYELRGDLEPLAVVEELVKGCAGRISEAGGIFKLQVGAPGAAVFSFSDGDIIVTRDQGYQPFKRLDRTFNAVIATYPEPDDMWSQKGAPSLYDAALEAKDGGRRLPFSRNYAAVGYVTQVQRLMKAGLLDERRNRTHMFYLPPEAWVLEPNDVVSWSSARNGYTNKKFIIVMIEGEPGMNQFVVIREIDPSDYDWDAESDEQDAPPASVPGPIRVPPQPMTGWQVEPATFDDETGAPRRPSIEVTFSGSQVDVRAVQVQVRLAATGALVFDGELPYGSPGPATKSVVLNAVLLSNTNYEVRGRFLPYTTRQTEWSDWLAVTTGNVPITDVSVALDALQNDVRSLLLNITALQDEFSARLEQVALATAEGAGVASEQRHVAVRERDAFAVALGGFEASIESINGSLTALSTAFLAVQSTVGDLSASGLLRLRAQAGTGDVVAEIVIEVRATTGDAWRQAGTIWQAGFTGGNPLAPFSRIINFADQFVITDGTNKHPPFLYSGGILYLDQVYLNGLYVVAGSLGRVSIPTAELTAFARGLGPANYVASPNPTSSGVIVIRSVATFVVNSESALPVKLWIAGTLESFISGGGVTGSGIGVGLWNNTTGNQIGGDVAMLTDSGAGGRSDVLKYSVIDVAPVQGNNTYSLRIACFFSGSTPSSQSYEFNNATVDYEVNRR